MYVNSWGGGGGGLGTSCRLEDMIRLHHCPVRECEVQICAVRGSIAHIYTYYCSIWKERGREEGRVRGREEKRGGRERGGGARGMQSII